MGVYLYIDILNYKIEYNKVIIYVEKLCKIYEEKKNKIVKSIYIINNRINLNHLFSGNH